MKLIIGFFLFTTALYAGWNEDFDVETISLIEQIEGMQKESYIKGYQEFIKLRDVFAADVSLKKEFRKSSETDKFEVIKVLEGFILKKRRDGNIKEAYVWDIAQFAGSSEYIVPSFAVDIGGKKLVFQKMERFTFGDKERKSPPSKILKKVSVKTYWKAHLQAYLFGFSDLVGRNIGINEEGLIRFFDNESSFNYYRNTPISKETANIEFVSQAFDWPQYREPLDRSAVEALNEFVQSLSDFEEHLRVYLSGRSIEINEEGLLYRLEKIRTFYIEEGMSFFDFYSFLYPKLSSGLDELSKIVSPIIGRRAGHGSALFFISRPKTRYKLSSKQRRAIYNWVDRYVE